MFSLLKYWHLDLMMVIFLIIICLLYYFLGGFVNNRKSVYFFAGYILIILSVGSPLHFLGENYLMSAHMLSHVILLLIAAPLLVLALPDNRNYPQINRISEFLVRHPWLPWMTGVCVMWFWHIPSVFNQLFESHNSLSIRNSNLTLNFLQNMHGISLVLAGILFSWPVVAPAPFRRIAPLNAVLYLTAACIFCSILGLLVTFAPAGIYTRYIHVDDRYGFLNMIRNENGISALVDQQMAGLIMWVPGCLIYLSASMGILLKWFREKNGKSEVWMHKIKQ